MTKPGRSVGLRPSGGTQSAYEPADAETSCEAGREHGRDPELEAPLARSRLDPDRERDEADQRPAADVDASEEAADQDEPEHEWTIGAARRLHERITLARVREAPLEDAGSGLLPASDGWFVVNVRDARWLTTEGGEKRTSGSETTFESPRFEFPQFAVRIHVLEPGESNGLYHAESAQEGFLVLSGECRLLVEGEERLLRPWDFFHCPAGTEHIFVGAGDGPCGIFMVGGRSEGWRANYPVSELAARYGASAAADTSDPDEAYVGFEPSRRERPSYWDRLPWA